MASIPWEYGLFLAGVLFSLGLVGVIVRRNLLFILLSVEVMLNAAGLAFIVAGARWAQADGQVMFIFLLAMAAAEVAVGLALLLLHYGRRKTLDADALAHPRYSAELDGEVGGDLPRYTEELDGGKPTLGPGGA